LSPQNAQNAIEIQYTPHSGKWAIFSLLWKCRRSMLTSDRSLSRLWWAARSSAL